MNTPSPVAGEQEVSAWVRLADSDWVNIVNAKEVLREQDAGNPDIAINAAVRLTEARLRELNAPQQGAPWNETEAEEALRSLASWLGVGGYNAPTVDAKVFGAKIRDGVLVYSQAHGFAARALAEAVLDMGLVTPKGLRARDLARQVLGIVRPTQSHGRDGVADDCASSEAAKPLASNGPNEHEKGEQGTPS